MVYGLDFLFALLYLKWLSVSVQSRTRKLRPNRLENVSRNRMWNLALPAQTHQHIKHINRRADHSTTIAPQTSNQLGQIRLGPSMVHVCTGVAQQQHTFQLFELKDREKLKVKKPLILNNFFVFILYVLILNILI